MNSRTIALVGEDNFNKLLGSRVLIAGLGGVGGYILESLVRAGVGTIGLCDFDVIDISNINRQILATTETIGLKKVDVAEKRAKSINPNVNIVKYDYRISDVSSLDLDSWDYIADAIDDVPAKIALMEAAPNKIISCMGTANKMDPFGFKIVPIEKTEGDPLARSIRKQLRDKNIKGVMVLFSNEEPIQKDVKPLPTISYQPAVAGLEISSFIIKKILAQ